ncbi:hypothetical protein [Streptacidiphilus cavernicola]|uniref:Uncharacterized protein n=1 Tax=Streptacidiphilus cavernicola TaxID=3342716 RepID=A0ABV6VSC9_9ACTN
MAYLSGPATAGLGTSTAVLDSAFVADSPLAAPSRSLIVAGHRTLIRYQSYMELRGAIERCCSSGQPTGVSRADINLASRFLMGKIIIDDDSLQILHTRMRREAKHLVDAIFRISAAETRIALGNVRDALANADGPAAEWNAQHACLSAFDAFLSSRGDLYPGTTHVWARWRRTVAKPMPFLPKAPDLANPNVFYGHTALAHDLLIQAATGEDYPIHRTVKPGTYYRTSDLDLGLQASGIVAHTAAGTVELDPMALLLLGVAQGRSSADTLDHTYFLLHRDTRRSARYDALTTRLRALTTHGLLLRLPSEHASRV